jgi:hypothetical protein
MGVRLYPATKKRRSLELLCNVPFGTYDKLDALVAEYGAEEAFYNAIYEDNRFNCNKLHTFLVFGWGKFIPTEAVKGDCGSTKVMDEIRDVMRINEIWVTLANLDGEGITWS